MNNVVVAFGRMNPMHIGHELVCKTMHDTGFDAKLYLSHKTGPNDPLDYNTKIEWAHKAFDKYVEVVNSSAASFLEALSEVYDQYGEDTNLYFVAGSDQSKEAEVVKRYNGERNRHGYYKFKTITAKQAGEDRFTLNEDDVAVEGASGTNQRTFAEEGDLESFMAYCPTTLSDDEKEDLFNDVRKGMGLFESLDELHEEDLWTLGISSVVYRGESSSRYVNEHKNEYGLFFTKHRGAASEYGDVARYEMDSRINLCDDYNSSYDCCVKNNLKHGKRFDDWAINQKSAKDFLEAQGYDGAVWSYEDQMDPYQFQIWNLDMIDRIGSLKDLEQSKEEYKELESDNDMDILEALEELKKLEEDVNEAYMEGDQDHVNKYFDRVVDTLATGVNTKHGIIKLSKKDISKLKEYSSSDHETKKQAFLDITGEKWGSVDKSQFSNSGKTSGNDLGFTVNGKTFTPIKVINPVDAYIFLPEFKNPNNSHIVFNDSNDNKLNENITALLKKVVMDCIDNVAITQNSDVLDYMKNSSTSASSNNFSLRTKYDVKKIVSKIGYNVLEELRSPFKNNFGEVFGGASLAAALSPTTYIKFPGASNYPIADYIISNKQDDKGSFKVSAKAAKLGKSGAPVSEGGKPGCGPIINDIYNGFKDGTLDKKLFTKDFINFISFMKANVYDPEGIHRTYENLANSLSNESVLKMLKFDMPVEVKKYTVPGSVNSKNIFKFATLFNKEKELKTDLVNDKIYCDAFRVKYVAQLFVKALNNNESIINQFTKAISLLFGVFIQLYIDDNSDFVNGDIKMFGEVVSANGEPLKIGGKGYHYEFVDNSSFNKKHQLDVTKLSMKLKQ